MARYNKARRNDSRRSGGRRIESWRNYNRRDGGRRNDRDRDRDRNRDNDRDRDRDRDRDGEKEKEKEERERREKEREEEIRRKREEEKKRKREEERKEQKEEETKRREKEEKRGNEGQKGIKGPGRRDSGKRKRAQDSESDETSSDSSDTSSSGTDDSDSSSSESESELRRKKRKPGKQGKGQKDKKRVRARIDKREKENQRRAKKRVGGVTYRCEALHRDERKCSWCEITKRLTNTVQGHLRLKAKRPSKGAKRVLTAALQVAKTEHDGYANTPKIIQGHVEHFAQTVGIQLDKLLAEEREKAKGKADGAPLGQRYDEAQQTIGSLSERVAELEASLTQAQNLKGQLEEARRATKVAQEEHRQEKNTVSRLANILEERQEDIVALKKKADRVEEAIIQANVVALENASLRARALAVQVKRSPTTPLEALRRSIVIRVQLGVASFKHRNLVVGRLDARCFTELLFESQATTLLKLLQGRGLPRLSDIREPTQLEGVTIVVVGAHSQGDMSRKNARMFPQVGTKYHTRRQHHLSLVGLLTDPWLMPRSKIMLPMTGPDLVDRTFQSKALRWAIQSPIIFPLEMTAIDYEWPGEGCVQFLAALTQEGANQIVTALKWPGRDTATPETKEDFCVILGGSAEDQLAKRLIDHTIGEAANLGRVRRRGFDSWMSVSRRDHLTGLAAAMHAVTSDAARRFWGELCSTTVSGTRMVDVTKAHREWPKDRSVEDVEEEEKEKEEEEREGEREEEIEVLVISDNDAGEDKEEKGKERNDEEKKEEGDEEGKEQEGVAEEEKVRRPGVLSVAENECDAWHRYYRVPQRSLRECVDFLMDTARAKDYTTAATRSLCTTYGPKQSDFKVVALKITKPQPLHNETPNMPKKNKVAKNKIRQDQIHCFQAMALEVDQARRDRPRTPWGRCGATRVKKLTENEGSALTHPFSKVAQEAYRAVGGDLEFLRDATHRQTLPAGGSTICNSYTYHAGRPALNPEACRLVLQQAYIAEGRQVFGHTVAKFASADDADYVRSAAQDAVCLDRADADIPKELEEKVKARIEENEAKWLPLVDGKYPGTISDGEGKIYADVEGGFATAVTDMETVRILRKEVDNISKNKWARGEGRTSSHMFMIGGLPPTAGTQCRRGGGGYAGASKAFATFADIFNTVNPAIAKVLKEAPEPFCTMYAEKRLPFGHVDLLTYDHHVTKHDRRPHNDSMDRGLIVLGLALGTKDRFVYLQDRTADSEKDWKKYGRRFTAGGTYVGMLSNIIHGGESLPGPRLKAEEQKTWVDTDLVAIFRPTWNESEYRMQQEMQDFMGAEDKDLPGLARKYEAIATNIEDGSDDDGETPGNPDAKNSEVSKKTTARYRKRREELLKFYKDLAEAISEGVFMPTADEMMALLREGEEA